MVNAKRILSVVLMLFILTPATNAQNLFDATPLTNLDPIRTPQSTYASIFPNGPEVALEAFTKRLQRNENNTFWYWAQPAWYHKAAYAVTIGGQSGSGVLIRTSDPRKFVLLTNSHVVRRDEGSPPSRTIRGTRSDGANNITGTLIAATSGPGYGEDVAMYRVEGDNLVGLPLLSRMPPIGSKIEVMGFGGPLYGTFRPFVADLIPEGSAKITLDSPTISGDSGSGMIYNAAVIGLNFGANKQVETTAGYTTPRGVQGIGLVWPASSDASPSFLASYVQGGCTPWGCSPEIYETPEQITHPSGGQYPGPEQFYPPSGWENQPQRPTQPTQPPSMFLPPQQPIAQPYQQPISQPIAQPYQQPYQQPPYLMPMGCPNCGLCPVCGNDRSKPRGCDCGGNQCPCIGEKKENANDEKSTANIEAKINTAVTDYMAKNAHKFKGDAASVTEEMKLEIATIAANSVVNSEAFGQRIQIESALHTDSQIAALQSQIPTVDQVLAQLKPIRVEFLGKNNEVSRVEEIDLRSKNPTLKLPPIKLLQERADGLYSIEKPLGEAATLGVVGKPQNAKK